MAVEKFEVLRAADGKFAKGYVAQKDFERIDKGFKAEIRAYLPECKEILMSMIRNDCGTIRCSTRVAGIKLIFEYAEGKPTQIINVNTSADNAPVEDLNRNEMRIRAESLDPAILELQEEMKQAEEYQAYIESKKQEKEKPKKKEKIINAT